MQGCPCLISNFNALCYDIESRVNKEISLNLLENMVLLFTNVCAFSFSRDVKKRFRAPIKKTKSRSLRREIKKADSSKNLDQ